MPASARCGPFFPDPSVLKQLRTGSPIPGCGAWRRRRCARTRSADLGRPWLCSCLAPGVAAQFVGPGFGAASSLHWWPDLVVPTVTAGTGSHRVPQPRQWSRADGDSPQEVPTGGRGGREREGVRLEHGEHTQQYRADPRAGQHAHRRATRMPRRTDRHPRTVRITEEGRAPLISCRHLEASQRCLEGPGLTHPGTRSAASRRHHWWCRRGQSALT